MILIFEEVVKETSKNKNDFIARGLHRYKFPIYGHFIFCIINFINRNIEKQSPGL